MTLGWNKTVANSMLDAALRAVAYTGPGTIWAQLHANDPSSTGMANLAQPSNNIRHTVAFSAASNGISANSTAVVWTSSDITVGTDYTFITLWNSSSAVLLTNYIASGTVVANPVSIGDTFTIAIGSLQVSQTISA